MKRSEMLDLMMEEIIHIEDIDGVSRLLKNMEDAGMLAPSIPNPNFQGGWNIHTYPAYVNEWEKEDEA